MEISTFLKSQKNLRLVFRWGHLLYAPLSTVGVSLQPGSSLTLSSLAFRLMVTSLLQSLPLLPTPRLWCLDSSRN